VSAIVENVLEALTGIIVMAEAPRSLQQGRVLQSYFDLSGFWVVPEDLYLFSCRQTSGLRDVDKPGNFPIIEASIIPSLSFVSCIAIYTNQQPDEEGLFWQWDENEPTETTHFQVSGADGVSFVPASCLSSLSDVPVLAQYNNFEVNEVRSSLLWLFSGAECPSYHALLHLDEFHLLGFHPNYGEMLQTDPGTYYGAYLDSNQFTPPSGLVWESLGDIWSWIFSFYSLSAPLFFLPSAPIPAPLPYGVGGCTCFVGGRGDVSGLLGTVQPSRPLFFQSSPVVFQGGQVNG